MVLAALTGLLALVAGASAQQYAGDSISAYLPIVPGAEVAFFKIPGSANSSNKHLTLINYYALGTNGGRIVESNIKRAVIPNHGILRDPWNYINDTMNALALAHQLNSDISVDSVAVLAPYFPNGDDKGFAYPWNNSAAPGEGSTSNALVWAGSRWLSGADNHYPHNSRHTSSYHVLDTLIHYFDNATLFPNLNQIVLVGHSAGGQTLQRYAAVSTSIANTRVPVVHWVGNPDSFAWLSEDRPLSINECADYDFWRNGFTNYTGYPVHYGDDLVAQGRGAILNNYDSKSIAYARAIYDHGNEASGCSPGTTGADRHERFFFYIQKFPVSCSDPTARDCDTVDLVPAQHDNGQMFKSAAGLARLFTDNFYGNNSRHPDFGYPRMQNGDDPYPDPALDHTPAPINAGVYAGNMTYQGCWANQTPLTPALLPTLMYASSNNTIEACTGACNNAGFSIAGLQNGTQCYCGNSMNQQSAVLVVDTACSIACPGQLYEICGGPTRVSVFSPGYPAFSN